MAQAAAVTATDSPDQHEHLVLRALHADDYHKGYMQLLSQLTVIGDVSAEAFSERLLELERNGDYKVMVIEDTQQARIVGTASLLVERKFIRNCGKCGHIEDVVVEAGYRGKHLGQRLIDALCDAAKDMGCYKVILDCSESNTAFYEKCGLVRKEVQMVRYF